jgi:3-isopropylmalate/(R)-2-methylmalate dehydratase small subunit
MVPDPALTQNAVARASQERALAYGEIEPGKPLEGLEVSGAFIGSCTNSRIDDLRAAADVLRGRKVSPSVLSICVPGSTAVKRQAEAEGLDRVFLDAGFQWRESGCSLCMSGATGGESFAANSRVIASTNRNFEDRQGPHVRSHLADGSPNPDFILNQAAYQGASFIVSGANFGCGSSREFAVWALRDFGIRAVLAPSFGAIFTANCYTNGLLPITLPEPDIAAIGASITPASPRLAVSLQDCLVSAPDGRVYPFKVPALQRERLLEGLDPIDHTRKRENLIAAFQEKDAALRPWVYWH